ncbi:MAG: Gfo/Idh/MocA family protein [Vicinamibacterales bacterium]
MILRIGIIGFGGAGQAHVKYFGCIPGCAVVRVFDPDPAGRARAVAAGLAVVDDLGRFWDGLDAVSVCAPDADHAAYLVEALERGLHTVCEKPLTDSVEGVRAIVRAARASRGVLAVVHQMRFVPLHVAVREAIQAGELGTLSYLEGYYVHDLRARAFVNHPWRAEDNATPLVYSGCHFIDLLRWLADDEIVQVVAMANHRAFPEYPESDLNVVLCRFASGILGKVVVAFGSGGPQDHSVRAQGTDGAIDNNVLFTRGGQWGRVLHEPMLIQPELLPRAGAPGLVSRARQLRVSIPARAAGLGFRALRWLARRPNAEYGARNYPLRTYEHSLACVRALEDFVGAVRDGRPPLCSVEESAQTVLACLAGVDAYRTGRIVAVPRLRDVV